MHETTNDFELLTPEVAESINAACERFEQAWQAGQRPRLEDYLLDALAGTETPVLLRELITLDVYYRRRTGENPQADDYRVRFPSLDGSWLLHAIDADLSAGTGAERSSAYVGLPRQGVSPLDLRGSLDRYRIEAELAHGGMGAAERGLRSFAPRGRWAGAQGRRER